jgi:hypothetical protein
MENKSHQELFDVLTRSRNVRVSKAASMAVSGRNKAQIIHDFLTKGI